MKRRQTAVDCQHRETTLLIGGTQESEGKRCSRSAQEIGDEEYPELRPGDHSHDGDAHGHGRVEGADSHAAHGKGAGKNGETNGKTIEGVSRGCFGGGGVDDDEDQGEGEEKLGEQCRKYS